MSFIMSRAMVFASVILLVGCGRPSDAPTKPTDIADSTPKVNDTKASPDERVSSDAVASNTKIKVKSRFWARKAGVDGAETELISDRVILESGTEIGWQIELEQAAHVYLIYRAANGDVEILFPSEGAQQITEKGLYTPVPNGSTLDEMTGVERFYLVASAQPLEPLESRIADFRSAPEEDLDRLKKPLLDALLEVRKQHEDVASAAGRPARIGGAVRSVDNKDNAVEYDVDGVVCRTFTIDHR